MRPEFARYLSAEWTREHVSSIGPFGAFYRVWGTYRGMVSFSSPETLTTSFRVPTDATPGQTIHALIQVTDNSTPALTSFQRVIVTVAR